MQSSLVDKNLKRKKTEQTEIYTMNSPTSSMYEILKVKKVEDIGDEDQFLRYRISEKGPEYRRLVSNEKKKRQLTPLPELKVQPEPREIRTRNHIIPVNTETVRHSM